jgi:hypothetical protein
MSAGRFLYQSGSKSPLGSGTSGPEGMAVRRTERIETWVGFIVLGSLARAARSWIWWALCKALEATVAASAQRMVYIFMANDPGMMYRTSLGVRIVGKAVDTSSRVGVSGNDC